VLYFSGFVFVQATQGEQKGENNNKQQPLTVTEDMKRKYKANQQA